MFCVIDFETTGFSPSGCDVIEYAAMRIGGEDEGEFIEGLCAPARSVITPRITQVNGIRPEDVKGKPPFEKHLHKFLAFIGNDTVVAHNVEFDMGFLRRYCNEAGLPAPVKTECTIRMARRCCPPPYKLEALANTLSISSERFHRALDDVRVTAQVFKCLREML
jgi:DNA polymerase III epsilon subunit family exonuclease